MKSMIIAAVEGKFSFNTIRSCAFENSLQHCEVDYNYCCRGHVVFNTIRSWAFVNSLEDCDVEDNCYCRGQVF